jgi:hypothetical protein
VKGEATLPQPGGLEGFRLAHVQLHLDHQPVPERGDPRELSKGHVDIRVAPAHPQVEQDDYTVPGVDQVVLELEGVPGAIPLSPELPNGLGPR